MPASDVPFSDVLLFSALLLATFAVGFLLGRFVRYLFIRKERSEAVSKSRSVILGELAEKILPILPDFPYAPKDLVFIGKGFDYLVLDGLSEGTLREIVFLEVKTGTSSLNANERMIRDVVKARKVRWEESRPEAFARKP